MDWGQFPGGLTLTAMDRELCWIMGDEAVKRRVLTGFQ